MTRFSTRMFALTSAALTTLALLASLFVGGAAQAQTGSFSVSGSTIYGPNGQAFVPKGVNVNGYNWVWGRSTLDEWNSTLGRSSGDILVNCWKFNFVRLNNAPLDSANYSTNNDIDKIIQYFTSKGVVVSIDAHDYIGQYYTGTSLTSIGNWFYNLAVKYKNNSYVWFDLQNEPGNANLSDRDLWVSTNRALIQRIRDDAGANNIIIVKGHAWGQDAGNWNTSNVPTTNSAILQWINDVRTFNNKTYGNIVADIHVYDQWGITASDGFKSDNRLANYIDRVKALNVPLVVGEFGVSNAGNNTRAATESLYSVGVPRGVGRVVWHWDGGDENDIVREDLVGHPGGGWKINSCTNPTNLTWLGQQVWNDTHSTSSSTSQYQAESGTVGGGSAVGSSFSGYTGSGYVDFGGSGSYNEMTVNRSSAGSATLTFRYANGSSVNRTSSVTVNGTNAGTVNFAPVNTSGNWAQWGTATLNVSLRSGSNTIRVTATTSNGGPNLDRMDVSP
jgi:hypothetical protein